MSRNDCFDFMLCYGITVAVTCRKLADVLKPVGVPTEICVVPVEFGWNWVVILEDPPLKTTGLVVMTPTLVFDDVTSTFTLKPPRNGCSIWEVSVTGCR